MDIPKAPSDWDRRTSIVATLGPATSSLQRIRELIEAGVDVVRLNFSHGTPDAHAKVYETVRDGERAIGKPVAIMQDLAGPKVRMGDLPGGKVQLREGERLTIATRTGTRARHKITTTHQRWRWVHS